MIRRDEVEKCYSFDEIVSQIAYWSEFDLMNILLYYISKSETMLRNSSLFIGFYWRWDVASNGSKVLYIYPIIIFNLYIIYFCIPTRTSMSGIRVGDGDIRNKIIAVIGWRHRI